MPSGDMLHKGEVRMRALINFCLTFLRTIGDKYESKILVQRDSISDKGWVRAARN